MVTINYLRRKYEDLSMDSTLVLCKLLDVDRSYIYAYGDDEVPVEIEDKYIQLMDKRKHGYPIQYILGEVEFMGLEFFLEEGVLIPRPDTEILVKYIIEYINKNHSGKNINVLDLGVGSGAISLSIAKYCKNTCVYGVDISPMAIKVSNINKKRHNLSNVNFYEGDLFEPVKKLNLEESFHIISSNPPYIAKEEIPKLEREVKDFEPSLALDGGLDGLDFYRRITVESKKYLVDNGLLIYEIGYDQGEAVWAIVSKEGFGDIKIIKDLQGHDRVVLGTL